MLINSTRLVQLIHPQFGRHVAVVREPTLLLLKDVASAYDLALEAINADKKLKDIIQLHVTNEALDYSSVYEGKNQWKLLPSFDHPENMMNCIVSGTGLTHKNSALNRQMMHQSSTEKPTDSMQMYQWGLEGGSPEKGTIGTQPEWFHKGNGSMLKAHGEPLEVPPFANDGGEEPEVAGVYLTDKNGEPWRIGFTTANEFSDHVMEKKNYLYLAPSKLRNCSIGPELVIDEEFSELKGTVKILRDEELVWSSPVQTGEKNMAHSLKNLEYHHFKYPCHRIPLQAHIHFFGADAFSFGSNIKLRDGDVMEINWDGMGRALQNPVKISEDNEKLVKVNLLK
ncbi:MAG: AraD1 family protein [Chitinophagaceae bacterium]